MVEFVANNNIFAFIKLFLFFATKKLHFYMSLDIVKLFNASICKCILK